MSCFLGTHDWGDSLCVRPDIIVRFHEGLEGDCYSLPQRGHIQHSAVQANREALLSINEDVVIRNQHSGAEEEHDGSFSIQCDIAAGVQHCNAESGIIHSPPTTIKVCPQPREW